MELAVALLAVCVVTVSLYAVELRATGKRLEVEVEQLEVRVERGRLASHAIIHDDTTRIPKPDKLPTATYVVTHNWYAPIPRLHVSEWSDSGLIGEGRPASRMQWRCPPRHRLGFDGGIPYCIVDEQP